MYAPCPLAGVYNKFYSSLSVTFNNKPVEIFAAKST